MSDSVLEIDLSAPGGRGASSILAAVPDAALALPAGMRELFLPSGRAVRLRRVRTGEYLEAKERASASTGDTRSRPDPNGTRFTAHLDREMVALAVVAYTPPQDLYAAVAAQAQAHASACALEDRRQPFLPDVDALLRDVPAEAWHHATAEALLTPGARHMEQVFDGVADWEVLTRSIGDMLVPGKDLSAIVGKARTTR